MAGVPSLEGVVYGETICVAIKKCENSEMG